MPHPAHDAIARHAYELWQNRGCPAGRDLEFWLEAERQLGGEGRAAFAEHVKAETAAESRVEFGLSAAVSEQAAIKAAGPTTKDKGPKNQNADR